MKSSNNTGWYNKSRILGPGIAAGLPTKHGIVVALRLSCQVAFRSPSTSFPTFRQLVNIEHLGSQQLYPAYTPLWGKTAALLLTYKLPFFIREMFARQGQLIHQKVKRASNFHWIYAPREVP